MNYKTLSDQKKKEYILKHYESLGKSFQEIASETNTYANKVRRDAIRFKIKVRDKSEAQKNALSSGKIKHPTKGQSRPDHIKQKIGSGVLKSWESISDEALKNRKLKAKHNWENKSEEEKQHMLREANLAVREASKKGSKLENFLLNRLLHNGYSVDFHKEQSILNTKLQIDLFLPKENIAIEIDGPSHFEPVWGSDALKRNKKYDDKKTGLILGKGLYLIRIKQAKDFSKTRAELMAQELMDTIKNIKNNTQHKVIKIGD